LESKDASRDGLGRAELNRRSLQRMGRGDVTYALEGPSLASATSNRQLIASAGHHVGHEENERDSRHDQEQPRETVRVAES